MIKDFAISKTGQLINLAISIAWIVATFAAGDRWWTWLWLVGLLCWDFLIFREKGKIKRK